MPKRRAFSVASILAILCSIGAPVEASPPLSTAKYYISALDTQIAEDCMYTKDELSAYKVDFAEYYNDEVLPRMEAPSRFIHDRAIHWIDVVPGGGEELVFWTEGLSPSSWGGKEYLYIVRPEGGKSVVLAKQHLCDPTPSRAEFEYSKSEAYPYPNSDCGYNGHTVFMLTYLTIGGSGSTASHYFVGYDRFDDSVYIDKLCASVLMEPSNCE